MSNTTNQPNIVIGTAAAQAARVAAAGVIVSTTDQHAIKTTDGYSPGSALSGWSTNPLGKGTINGTSDGSASQQFNTNPDFAFLSTNLVYGADVDVTVNGVAWTLVADLSGSGPTDQVFTATPEDLFHLVIQFGDGTNGAIPPNGQAIAATFETPCLFCPIGPTNTPSALISAFAVAMQGATWFWGDGTTDGSGGTQFLEGGYIWFGNGSGTGGNGANLEGGGLFTGVGGSINCSGGFIVSPTYASSTILMSSSTWSIVSNGNYVLITANAGAGTTTFHIPATGLQVGMPLVLRFTQNSGGNRHITWAAGYKFPGGVKPDLTQSTGTIDLFEFWSPDGATLELLKASQDVR